MFYALFWIIQWRLQYKFQRFGTNCMFKNVGISNTNAVKLQSWLSQLKYARYIPSAVCVEPPEDEQLIHKTCRGP
jgi:hypothetical protein